MYTATRTEAALTAVAAIAARRAQAAVDQTPSGPTAIRNIDGEILAQFRAPQGVTWGDINGVARTLAGEVNHLLGADARHTNLRAVANRASGYLAYVERMVRFQAPRVSAERAWETLMQAQAYVNHAYSLPGS